MRHANNQQFCLTYSRNMLAAKKRGGPFASAHAERFVQTTDPDVTGIMTKLMSLSSRYNMRPHEVNIPTTGGWYIFLFETSTVNVPGDERSRTNPGHGYPAHTVTTRDVIVYRYESQEEMSKALKALWDDKPSRKDVFACHVDKVAKAVQSVEFEVT